MLPLTVTTENPFRTYYLGASETAKQRGTCCKARQPESSLESHGRTTDFHELSSDLNTNAMALKCLHT